MSFGMKRLLIQISNNTSIIHLLQRDDAVIQTLHFEHNTAK